MRLYAQTLKPGTRWQTGRFAHVDRAGRVASRQDAQRVIAQMRADLDGLPGRSAWQGKAEPAQPDWALLADILVAATGYQ